MSEKKFRILAIIFSVFLILFIFKVGLQIASADYQDPQLKIISVTEDGFKGGNVQVKGQAMPNSVIFLDIKDINNTFTYSIKSDSDGQGDWFAKFDQPLKSGKYYVEAASQDQNGVLSLPVKSDVLNIKGSFSLIIEIFSLLVIILLLVFVGGWYFSKVLDIKRYRRILVSQRDIKASYKIFKNDVDRVMKILEDNKVEDREVNEMKFYITRVRENLEKMNNYVVKGIEIIATYNIISKIDSFLSLKKNKSK